MNHTIFKFEKLFIFFCILSIFTINNIATLYEIVNREQSSYSRVIQNINLNPDSTEQLKYVDSSCETTILEFFQNKQKISAIKNLKATEYYNEITGNPLCHYRIIKSNSNNTIVSGENNGFSTGIGIFEDFENIKKTISFNLLIFLIGICYQKNKERTQRAMYSKNIITVNLLTLVYSLFVAYLLPFSNFYYFITSIFIPIIIQTNLFNLVFNHFEELLKTIFTTMFLPL